MFNATQEKKEKLVVFFKDIKNHSITFSYLINKLNENKKTNDKNRHINSRLVFIYKKFRRFFICIFKKYFINTMEKDAAKIHYGHLYESYIRYKRLIGKKFKNEEIEDGKNNATVYP
ncbi:hypothetical protein H312_02307 [Anncaliia algerae PRA339]|uniref:Uncharacterized protein n=1 Tax=Anncaliia algerae PRA339 TaxID=1288291 RepID=A0A059EYZ3_9MICR|nr:hypothetical protein H312_02307 [Anncaliia algerae PRA339]